jgi:hypothetical protein
LEAKLAEADGLIETGYLPDSWALFVGIRESARKTYLNDDAEQWQIEAALAELTAAVESLAPNPVVDKTPLRAKIDEANKLAQADYTPESWQPFRIALLLAQTAYDNESNTQERVNTAYAYLVSMMENLVPVSIVIIADKSELQAKLIEAGVLNEADYAPEAWAPFLAVRDAAWAVYFDEKATGEQIASILGELTQAIGSLAIKPILDKAALGEALAEANTRKQTDFTPESWQPFRIARVAAQTAFDNPDTTQEKIDAALAYLAQTMANLVPAKIIVMMFEETIWENTEQDADPDVVEGADGASGEPLTGADSPV